MSPLVLVYYEEHLSKYGEFALDTKVPYVRYKILPGENKRTLQFDIDSIMCL